MRRWFTSLTEVRPFVRTFSELEIITPGMGLRAISYVLADRTVAQNFLRSRRELISRRDFKIMESMLSGGK